MPTRSHPHRSPVTNLLALLVCCSLLFSTFARSRQWSGTDQTQLRRGNPEAGPPEVTLPNLDDVRRQRHPKPAAPPHIPSLMRGRRKPLEPRNGRKVGDPGTTGAAVNEGVVAPVSVLTANALRAQSHHPRRRNGALSPSGLVDYQYVQALFQAALARQPSATEQAYWNDMLRAALAHGQGAPVLAVREMGKTLFESAEYGARNQNNHWYVSDLYQTYLRRAPDAGGWAFWESLVPAIGREDVRRAFDESGEFASDVSTVSLTGSASSAVCSLLTARVDPSNRSGNQIMARDAEWSVSLLALPGRAGLDLGLSLSYSSAATWTRSGPYIYFDEDNSSLSPGFRLGFPTVQELFFNAQTGQNAYLLLTAHASKQCSQRHAESERPRSYLRFWFGNW